MKLATFTTREEKDLWNSMKSELHQHSQYSVRKQYYPFKMDLWETMRKSIENDYRSKIMKLQKEIKVRKLQEEESAKLRKLQEEESAKLRKLQEEEKRRLRKNLLAKEKKETIVVLRRSNRLSSAETRMLI
jgi:DNA-binding transcriptional regulator GbsR (MarR family)